MSLISILLWAVLSTIILGATFWNSLILQKQKKAWAAFADKKGLMFQKGTFSGPCAMDGVINGYQVSFFTAEQQNPDARKRRKVTGVQVNLTEGIVDSMAAATVEMLPFVKSLPEISPYKPKAKNWDKNHYLFVKNTEAIDVYLNDERAEAIKKLLNMKNADVILLIDDSEAVIRFETANPLNDIALLEKVMKATLTRLEVLKVSKAEKKELKKIIKQNEDKDDEEDETEVAASEKSKSKGSDEKEEKKSDKKEDSAKKPQKEKKSKDKKED